MNRGHANTAQLSPEQAYPAMPWENPSRMTISPSRRPAPILHLMLQQLIATEDSHSNARSEPLCRSGPMRPATPPSTSRERSARMWSGNRAGTTSPAHEATAKIVFTAGRQLLKKSNVLTAVQPRMVSPPTQTHAITVRCAHLQKRRNQGATGQTGQRHR